MGKIVARNVVTRKPHHLYYVDANGNVCEAKMSRGGKKKKKSTSKKKSSTKKSSSSSKKKTTKKKKK